MDSSKIRSLATGAREALRAEVSARLDAVLAEGSRERLEQPEMVRAVERDAARDRDELVDRAAYTWFNRLCALRYMDANGHTSSPVVTPRAGSTLPGVLADASQGAFDPEYALTQADRDAVTAVLSGAVPSDNAQEDAYALLLSAVCRRYAGPMPYLFSEDVASSLLMPRGLLAEGSILRRIAADMDAEACSSVEVLGWLYQFYIAERKDEYFASKRKASAADIAPATQLFTPEWIVRYLCENSLGRLWALNNPGTELPQRMDYYIAPEGGEEHLEIASASEIRVLDPACGSGHILVYAFDLLFAMYEEEGWPAESIPEMILTNNLKGLEIDRRAAEIAMFALEMKALERDPGFLGKEVDADVTVLEPVELDGFELGMLSQGFKERAGLLDAMAHMGEVGSLYVPDPADDTAIRGELARLEGRGDAFSQDLEAKLRTMLANVEALSGRYHCVIANPPYMSSGNMNPWLSAWVKDNCPDERGDLCTCFITRGLGFAERGGMAAVITSDTCMYLSSFEKMRQRLISSHSIRCFIDTRGTNAHPDVFDANAGWVICKGGAASAGTYVKLNHAIAKKAEALREAVRNPDCGWCYRADAEDFKAIPGSPIAYWASDSIFSCFKNNVCLCDVTEARQGFTSGDNARFLRLWFEVSSSRTAIRNRFDKVKWVPCDKGGHFRKWYGNNQYVANWENDGEELKEFPGSTIRNAQYYFKESFSWSDVSSASLACRYKPEGFVFEHCSDSLFGSFETLLSLGSFLNSTTAAAFLKILSPTMKFEVGQIRLLPVVVSTPIEMVNTIANSNIELSRNDWDAFETSWDFSRHPLVRTSRVEDAYTLWEGECRERFDTLKANEEELNRIFARIYSMEAEVPVEVPDDKVSVRLADLQRDVKSLVSFAVGCLLGRYSLDADGLVLADQGATLSDYLAKVPEPSLVPDEDNILPVLDGEWFEDDVVSGIYRFLAAAYGEEHLDDNVAFIEDALGCDLRTYMVRDFYKDHCSTYSVTGSGKRPIYWLIQSPKKGFSCLVYMHRYSPGLFGEVLTGYLRPFMEKISLKAESLVRSGRPRDLKEADKLRARLAELEAWERDVIYPLAHERVEIDLDDGVKVNYNKFPHALAKVTGLSEWK